MTSGKFAGGNNDRNSWMFVSSVYDSALSDLEKSLSPGGVAIEENPISSATEALLKKECSKVKVPSKAEVENVPPEVLGDPDYNHEADGYVGHR